MSTGLHVLVEPELMTRAIRAALEQLRDEGRLDRAAESARAAATHYASWYEDAPGR